MKLSAVDEQFVREYARANTTLIDSVISPSAESAHQEDNLIGELFSVALFLSFIKAVAETLDQATTITKVVDKAATLFKWVQAKLRDEPTADASTLKERILVVLFEVYSNQKRAGVSEERLSMLLATDSMTIVKALESLQSHGVIRKSKSGSWKYVRG